jgi:hypothetical protein
MIRMATTAALVLTGCNLVSGVDDFRIGGDGRGGATGGSGGSTAFTSTTAMGGSQPLPTSCLEVLESNPGRADGLYLIDPDGPAAAAPFEAECDMTLAGGGWTRFHWLSGPFPAGADPLGDTLHECDPSAARCFGRIPGPALPTQLLVRDHSDGDHAFWTFDGSAVSNAVLAALQLKTPACIRDQGAFMPSETSSSEPYCGTGDEGGCDSFTYSDAGCAGGPQAWALNLDGDNWACASAFKLGAVPDCAGDADYGYLDDCDCNDESGALYYR